MGQAAKPLSVSMQLRLALAYQLFQARSASPG
mgnify:CR=1 FL=1